MHSQFITIQILNKSLSNLLDVLLLHESGDKGGSGRVERKEETQFVGVARSSPFTVLTSLAYHTRRRMKYPGNPNNHTNIRCDSVNSMITRSTVLDNSTLHHMSLLRV